jgi:hypothetical protein
MLLCVLDITETQEKNVCRVLENLK